MGSQLSLACRCSGPWRDRALRLLAVDGQVDPLVTEADESGDARAPGASQRPVRRRPGHESTAASAQLWATRADARPGPPAAHPHRRWEGRCWEGRSRVQDPPAASSAQEAGQATHDSDGDPPSTLLASNEKARLARLRTGRGGAAGHRASGIARGEWRPHRRPNPPGQGLPGMTAAMRASGVGAAAQCRMSKRGPAESSGLSRRYCVTCQRGRMTIVA